jgi:hypothetical protein
MGTRARLRCRQYGRPVRWDRLFTDLEAEASELSERERDAEIADRTRAELARTRWADRVRASTGSTVRLRLLGADLVEGAVLQVAADWLLLRAGAHDVLVPLHSVVGVEGVTTTSEPLTAVAAATPTWASAWRVLARDRAPVRVVRVGGSTVHGVPTRVGADFVELDPGLVHEARPAPVLVPYAAISAAYVRRPDDGDVPAT